MNSETKTVLRVVVYHGDGSIEATAHADRHVASGVARYATRAEVSSYERQFAGDDARIAAAPARPWYSPRQNGGAL